jgi:glycosyltransferase involved in cell wall biosynthesis
MVKIGGTCFVHDPIRLDYCYVEAIESLLGVCDEVVVVDAESTDGASDVLREWSEREPKLRILSAPWNPVRGLNGAWLADLANHARRNLTAEYHVGLQADEVLHPDDYDQIRSCARVSMPMRCLRFNFWGNARTIANKGYLCGDDIVRGGPSWLTFVGDAEGLLDENIARRTSVRIYHVGFIRRPLAFAEKAIAMEEAFFETHNPILDRMQTEGESALAGWVPPEGLRSFSGPWPPNLIPWLEERGRL